MWDMGSPYGATLASTLLTNPSRLAGSVPLSEETGSLRSTLEEMAWSEINSEDTLLSAWKPLDLQLWMG
jgi:hypothetical protein